VCSRCYWQFERPIAHGRPPRPGGCSATAFIGDSLNPAATFSTPRRRRDETRHRSPVFGAAPDIPAISARIRSLSGPLIHYSGSFITGEIVARTRPTQARSRRRCRRPGRSSVSSVPRRELHLKGNFDSTGLFRTIIARRVCLRSCHAQSARRRWRGCHHRRCVEWYGVHTVSTGKAIYSKDNQQAQQAGKYPTVLIPTHTVQRKTSAPHRQRCGDLNVTTPPAHDLWRARSHTGQVVRARRLTRGGFWSLFLPLLNYAKAAAPPNDRGDDPFP